MDIINKQDLHGLFKKCRPPAISLLLPTHRGGSEQDRIRLKNLIARAQEALGERGLAPSQIRDLLGPARYLLEDVGFWPSVGDGLALFLAPGVSAWYRVPVRLSETAVVGNRFHVKPLLPLLSDNGRFFILALSQKHVSLFQGTRDGVSAIDLKGVPTSLAEAMRFHDTDEPLMFHCRRTSGGTWGAIFHGQGVGIDDHKDDLLRYFQQIDRGLHQLLRDERAPLILAAVEYLWPIYQKANTYPYLLKQGVPGSPDHLSAADLHAHAWPLVRERFKEPQHKDATVYARLAGTGRTTNDLTEAVRAAYQGGLEVLFVAADQDCWGTLDATTATITHHAAREPGDEDLLNLAAASLIQGGGRVYVLPRNEIPGGGPLAGIFWLPER